MWTFRTILHKLLKLNNLSAFHVEQLIGVPRGATYRRSTWNNLSAFHVEHHNIGHLEHFPGAPIFSPFRWFSPAFSRIGVPRGTPQYRTFRTFSRRPDLFAVSWFSPFRWFSPAFSRIGVPRGTPQYRTFRTFSSRPDLFAVPVIFACFLADRRSTWNITISDI